MIKHLRQLGFLAAFALGAAAQAGTVHVVFDTPIFNGSGYDNVNISYVNPNANGPSVSEYVSAGRFQGTGTNPVGVAPGIFVDSLKDLYMYCYDIFQNIGPGYSVDYTVNLNGEFARTLDFLGAVNAVMNGGKSVGDVGYDQHAWLHPINGYQGAAIQIGIWESRYDSSSWDLGAGAFRVTGLETDTDFWWNDFKNHIATTDALDGKFVMTFESPLVQDMIAGDPPVEVPEPGSLALLGIALTALVAVTRSKKRQATTAA